LVAGVALTPLRHAAVFLQLPHTRSPGQALSNSVVHLRHLRIFVDAETAGVALAWSSSFFKAVAVIVKHKPSVVW
jgi:hypothetical protein